MTLNQLSKINPEAAQAWRDVESCKGGPLLTPEQEWLTTRAYRAGGKLFLVWNNGCYYESFIYENKRWRSLSESRSWRSHLNRVPKYYKQACKTLGDLDRSHIYG